MSIPWSSFDVDFAKMVERLQINQTLFPMKIEEKIQQIQRCLLQEKDLLSFLQQSLCDVVFDVTKFPKNLSRQQVIEFLQVCFLKWNEPRLFLENERENEIFNCQKIQGNIQLLQVLEKCSFDAYLFPEMQEFFQQENIRFDESEIDRQKMFQKRTFQIVKHDLDAQTFQEQAGKPKSAFRRIHQEKKSGLHKSADFEQMDALSTILTAVHLCALSGEELLTYLQKQIRNIQNNPFDEQQLSEAEQIELFKEIFHQLDRICFFEEREKGKKRLWQTMQECQFSRKVVLEISQYFHLT